MNAPYQNLLNFVDNLIIAESTYCDSHKTLNFDDLSDHDKYEFASLLLEYDDRDITFYLNENEKYDDIISSLILSLKKDTQKDDINFVNNLKANIVSYYQKQMKELINERLQHVETEELHDHGYVKYQGRNTGEIKVMYVGRI